jgi:hypothetical protein
MRASRPHEGRFAIVTIRGAGCDRRVAPQGVRHSAYGQAVWSCPPDAGVKFSEMIGRRWWLKSPVHQGEHGVSRKAIAQGVPDVFRPYLTILCAFLPFAHKPAGAASARHSLRPLLQEGHRIMHHPDAMALRECEIMFLCCRPGQANALRRAAPSRSERDPGPITRGRCCAKVRATARRSDSGLWLWVPAFAGTTDAV